MGRIKSSVAIEMFKTENRCKTVQVVAGIDATQVLVKAPISESRHDYYCRKHVLKLC